MGRTLIIGDIHGCYDELLELFDVAALAADDLVVSVGDLVDRGPKPGEVVSWFRSREGSIVLMGNHERKHVRRVFSYSQEITRLQLGNGDAYAEIVGWMAGLPYFYETEAVRVVHAAVVPGVPLAEQAETILCGTASGEAQLKKTFPSSYWHEHYTDDVPIVFGHHVTGAEPLLRDGKIYGIDTGACHGLRLTALSVPDFKLYSVPSRADHWRVSACEWQVPVLRTRPWETMSWTKLEETLADFRGDLMGDLEGDSYLAILSAWAEKVRALIPTLFERVPMIVESMHRAHGSSDVHEAMDAHPAKPLLFLHTRKRLTLDAVKTRCTTPKTTLELATKLGVDVSSYALPR